MKGVPVADLAGARRRGRPDLNSERLDPGPIAPDRDDGTALRLRLRQRSGRGQSDGGRLYAGHMAADRQSIDLLFQYVDAGQAIQVDNKEVRSPGDMAG